MIQSTTLGRMEKVTFKNQPIKILGSTPAIGSKAPELIGVGTDLKDHSLKDYQGKKKIICFAPSVDTSVCSTAAQKFNQKIEGKKNTVVLYCTMDLPFALKRICGSYSHVTPLSLFRTPEVAVSYGARQADGPLEGLCARAVFVLDEHDKVLYHELVKEITNEPDYETALTVVS